MMKTQITVLLFSDDMVMLANIGGIWMWLSERFGRDSLSRINVEGNISIISGKRQLAFLTKSVMKVNT